MLLKNMKTKRLENTEILDVESIMQEAEPCTLFEDIIREMREERNKLTYDPYLFERGQAYSVLSKQVVGAEDL